MCLTHPFSLSLFPLFLCLLHGVLSHRKHLLVAGSVPESRLLEAADDLKPFSALLALHDRQEPPEDTPSPVMLWSFPTVFFASLIASHTFEMGFKKVNRLPLRMVPFPTAA